MSDYREEKKIEHLNNCVGTETSTIIEICEKLSDIEKNWSKLFSNEGHAVAKQTALGKCTVEPDGITVEVNTANNSIVTSLKFKEKIFRTTIERFLGTKIKKIEFSAGKIKKVSTAKEASKSFERYAPIVVCEEVVQKAKEELLFFTQDEQLAEVMGKTKAMAEKKIKRKTKFFE